MIKALSERNTIHAHIDYKTAEKQLLQSLKQTKWSKIKIKIKDDE